MTQLLEVSWFTPASMSSITLLSQYHANLKPLLWGFIIFAVLFRIFSQIIMRTSYKFRKAPAGQNPIPPAQSDSDIFEDAREQKSPSLQSEKIDEEEEEEEEEERDEIPVSPIPEATVPIFAKDEKEAISWMIEYGNQENAGYVAKHIYRVYELWIPLALREKNSDGVPAWVRALYPITRTAVIVAVIAVAMSLASAFAYRISQDPILGLITCDKELIDAALHCDAYTESCYLTPPCGPHAVDYARLVETYHDKCTGSTYPKISTIKNVCFMEKDSDLNSWRHIWHKMVGADFYSLEHTLIAFYQSNEMRSAELRAIMNQPVRIFYDQIGNLVGYGVNTITPEGVVRTNINHDDLMSFLTTWRTKKLSERKRQKPCICAPHMGILNRMLFMWEEDANAWQIFVDHNVSKFNAVYGEGHLVPRYDDFPRNVDTQIATSIRKEDPSNHHRSYPAASVVDLLEVPMDISSVRPIDIQTTKQIRRHWSLEGPILQTQIPHVYFDASLDTFYQSDNQHVARMSKKDGVVHSKRITDPVSACYYQCARIFDQLDA